MATLKTKHASKPKVAADLMAPPNSGGNLTRAQEKALAAEVHALGGDLLPFPGNAAKRFAWAEKIQHAAERDASDLVQTPFHGEPPLTHEEIRGQLARIVFLRRAEARWQMVQADARKAAADLTMPLSEAAQHRAALLRFFTLRYRNDPEGRKWIAHVREGRGDADLVQDVADILERCKLDRAGIAEAPRAEANARDRLEALFPALQRLLSARAIGPEELSARAQRDGAYTLVMRCEQRLRAAAGYWYGDADKMKDYAAFVPTPGARVTGVEGEQAPEAPEAPVAPPS